MSSQVTGYSILEYIGVRSSKINISGMLASTRSQIKIVSGRFRGAENEKHVAVCSIPGSYFNSYLGWALICTVLSASAVPDAMQNPNYQAWNSLSHRFIARLWIDMLVLSQLYATDHIIFTLCVAFETVEVDVVFSKSLTGFLSWPNCSIAFWTSVIKMIRLSRFRLPRSLRWP